MTPTEIAAALFAAPHLNVDTLAPLYEYRRAKRVTGAPVDLEDAAIDAAVRCQEAADALRTYLTKAAKEAAESLAGLDAIGSRMERTWFVLELWQSAETLAARMTVARYAFRDALKLWVTLADRIVATPEETEARAEEEADRRQAAVAAWIKLDRASLAAVAGKRGVAADGTKTEMALALVNAGHFS